LRFCSHFIDGKEARLAGFDLLATARQFLAPESSDVFRDLVVDALPDHLRYVHALGRVALERSL